MANVKAFGQFVFFQVKEFKVVRIIKIKETYSGIKAFLAGLNSFVFVRSGQYTNHVCAFSLEPWNERS